MFHLNCAHQKTEEPFKCIKIRRAFLHTPVSNYHPVLQYDFISRGADCFNAKDCLCLSLPLVNSIFVSSHFISGGGGRKRSNSQRVNYSRRGTFQVLITSKAFKTSIAFQKNICLFLVNIFQLKVLHGREATQVKIQAL